MRRTVLLACAALAVPCIALADTWVGRWANDARACKGEGENAAIWPLIVTANSLKWSKAVCTVGLSYKLRDSWHISARCWGEGRVSTLPITLRMRGERLVVEWGTARAEELRRCP